MRCSTMRRRNNCWTRRHGWLTGKGSSQRLGDVLVTRAIALHELGRRAEARRDLARAELLVLDERRPEINLQLAVLEKNAGQVKAAVALYHRVLAAPRCPPD